MTIESPSPLPRMWRVFSLRIRTNSPKSCLTSSVAHADARVGHGDRGLLAGASQGHVHPPAVAIVLDGVGEQVVEDDLDFAGVGGNHQRRRRHAVRCVMPRWAAWAATASMAAAAAAARSTAVNSRFFSPDSICVRSRGRRSASACRPCGSGCGRPSRRRRPGRRPVGGSAGCRGSRPRRSAGP